MRAKTIFRSFFITLFSMSILTAAQHIVPADDGYFYTDSMNSKIYYTDGSTFLL
ncbi:MAG: hypothetical protein KAU44_02900 [Candidatus Marinimicrobia bacterium]|nr:hypothetical protein [Candidatus Neomarinimicrobiota bacterium]